MVQYFIDGGGFMWPILISLVFGLGFAFERAYSLLMSSIDSDKFFTDVSEALEAKGVDVALEVCNDTKGPVAEIFHGGLTKTHRGVSEVEKNSGRFPQVSGMSFTYNQKAKAGGRVGSVKIGNKPLNKGRTYTMATNDYLAKGGDGYSVFKKGKVIIDASGATLMASMVMDYIKAKGTVSPKVEGRIVAQ